MISDEFEKTRGRKVLINTHVLDQYGPSIQAVLGDLVRAGMNDIAIQIRALINLNNIPEQEAMIRAVHSIKSCSEQVGGEELSAYSLMKEQQYVCGELASLTQDIKVLSEMFDCLKREMVNVLAERNIDY